MTGRIFSDGFEGGTTNAWSMTSHTNGIHDVHWMDGSSMQRPARIRARRAGAFPWDPGAYQFDGAGNVTAIGAQTFTYDEGNRLAQSQADDGFGVVTQTYGYDGFGNLVSITDPQGTRTFEADLATNRLAAAAYDAAGNLTSWGGFSYEWRPTGELRTRTGTGLNTWFAYDAGGERVVVHDRLSGRMTFTIRDLDGKVLRVFERDAGGSWSWEKDYVYRNGLLLAAKDPAGTVHFTLDHLGTPRYVTDAAGNEVARHSYFGFGEEATSAWRDEAMKFTGHERDLEGTPNRLDDLDYMHARYYNPLLARFLSVDPIGGSIGASQSFNRYAYVGNSPLNYVDPFGLARLVADRNGAYHFEDEIEVNATALQSWPDIRMAQWTVENHRFPGEEAIASGSGVTTGPDGDIQTSEGGSTSATAPLVAAATISVGLLADDVTGIGVLNDAAIPPVLIAGALLSAAPVIDQVMVKYWMDRRGKGERRKAARPDGTPDRFKHTKPHPADPGKIVYKDPHTGKKVVKPKPPGYPK